MHKSKENKITDWKSVKLSGPACFIGQDSSDEIIYNDNTVLLRAITPTPLVWMDVYEKLSDEPTNNDVVVSSFQNKKIDKD